MKCENCQGEHNGNYGSGRFCSVKCSRSFSTKNKRRDINERVSKKLAGKPKNPSGIIEIQKFCKICGAEFSVKWRKRDQLYCSVKCSLGRPKTEEEKIKNREAQLKLVKEGKHQGWKARTKKPSYAEKYFIDLFNEEEITGWEREYKVDKYFIDFAFADKKIALEIDGKQHRTDRERIEKDKEKNSVLEKNGWRVIRIDWRNPINEINKERLYNQINEFFQVLNRNKK